MLLFFASTVKMDVCCDKRIRKNATMSTFVYQWCFACLYKYVCLCIFSTKEPGSVAPCQHCGCISNQGNQFGSKGPRQSSLAVFVSGFVFRFCTTLIVFVFAFFTSGICACICICQSVFVSVTSHRFGAAVLSIFCALPLPSAVICRYVICNCNLWQETTHCKFSTTLHNSTSWGLQLPRITRITVAKKNSSSKSYLSFFLGWFQPSHLGCENFLRNKIEKRPV